MRKAIVMAGGRGSRLWPLTTTRPKPMVPVMNRPMMAHILGWLQVHDFTEVLVTLHYRADDILRAFGNQRSAGMHVQYTVEDEPLGTAGSVKAIETWMAGEPFLVVSGDALTDIDLAALQCQHQETGAWLTMGLKRVLDPSEYGVVTTDCHGRVIGFQEKPGLGHAQSHLANTGIYCVEPQVLEWVPSQVAYDWSQDLFPQLLAEGLPLFGQEVDGYWCDIGTMEEYRRGHRDALAGAVRVAIPGEEVRPRVWLGPGVQIAPSAVVEGPVLLGAGCRIEPDALVLPGSVLGEGAMVRAGACTWGSIVGTGCQVGAGAVVRDSVLDDGAWIGARSTVGDGAIIGRGCRVAAGTHVSGCRVGPDQIVAQEWSTADESSKSVPDRRLDELVGAQPLSMHRRGSSLVAG